MDVRDPRQRARARPSHVSSAQAAGLRRRRSVLAAATRRLATGIALALPRAGFHALSAYSDRVTGLCMVHRQRLRFPTARRLACRAGGNDEPGAVFQVVFYVLPGACHAMAD